MILGTIFEEEGAGLEESGSNRFTPGRSICSGLSNGVRMLGNTGCQKAELIDASDGKFMQKSEAAWSVPDKSAPLRSIQ